MKWIKRHLITLILLAIGIVGAGLIAYPTFSDWWNSFHQSRAIASYTETVAALDDGKRKEILKAADDYNKRLAETGMRWNLSDEGLKEYESQLKVDDTEIMGYITIPKIRLSLPIYHGVDEAVLQIAIGHIPGTSLPVGGKSTHTVVSGHRGLPSAKLFTDIDKLVVGDVWTITTLDRTVSYEADKIWVVDPDDLSKLEIEQGKDYCTLVTCTPYGINTHRLLVRGHRVPNPQGDAGLVAEALQEDPHLVAMYVAAPIVVLILVLWILYEGRRRKKNGTAPENSRKAKGTAKKKDGAAPEEEDHDEK